MQIRRAEQDRQRRLDAEEKATAELDEFEVGVCEDGQHQQAHTVLAPDACCIVVMFSASALGFNVCVPSASSLLSHAVPPM